MAVETVRAPVAKPDLRSEVTGTWRNPAVRRGLVGSVLLLGYIASPAFLKGVSPTRGLPVNPTLQGALTMLAMVCLLVGAALLLDAWLQLRGSRVSARMTVVLWSLPLLVAPPMFSGDAFSYGAQGELVALHLDPYVVGPGIGSEAYAAYVDTLWMYTPAPYGPLGLQVSHAIVLLTGHNPWWSAVLMRLPALVGVAMLAWALRRLAPVFGANPDRVLWWGVLNPLVLMHFIGGSHNDALMVGIAAVALVVASRGHLLGSAALIGLAFLVKQPAAFILAATCSLAVVAKVKQGTPTTTQIVRGVVASGAGFAVAVVAASKMLGLGFGWIHAATVPGSVASLAPSSILGRLVTAVARGLGFGYSEVKHIAPFLTAAILAAGLTLTVFLAVKAIRDVGNVATYLTWGLLVLAACLPALQVWYLLWGGAFLGLTKMSWSVQRWVQIAVVVLVGYALVDAVTRTGTLSFAILGIVALVWRFVVSPTHPGNRTALAQLFSIRRPELATA